MNLAPTGRLLRAPLRAWVVPKAHIHAKPAKTPVAPSEQAVGLSVIFLAFLTPAGWVLTHLESYKKSAA